MTRPSTEERIRELAGALEPVRPLPPLFAVVALAVALCLVAVAAEWSFGGVGLRVRGDSPWREPAWAAAFAGIAALGFGALGAALARAIPGREATARLGGGVALAGLALGLAGAAFGLAGHAATPADGWLGCCLRAFALGAASGALAFVFLARAAPRSLGLSAGLAFAGGVALGALVVHLTCPSSSVLHQLFGHTLAPLAAGLALALPGAALLRKLSSGSR